MSKPIVVNLFGGPGCGKSSSAAAIFSILKLHDINAELVTEFAKDLTWEDRSVALSNQYYIWGKQFHRMERIFDKVDVIITDSPLLLSSIYNKDYNIFFDAIVLDAFNKFANINFVLNRTKKYHKEGRSQTEDEARNIDERIKSLLANFKIDYTIVDGNCKGINTIVTIILEILGIDQNIFIECKNR
jgi:ABC-type dipeptide/oligopeptide/nickel transport system ATPase component